MMRSISFWLPGSIRSLPALALFTVPALLPQSVITMPLKPHSSRRTVVSRSFFCWVYSPLSWLYDDITVQGSASLTAISKFLR